MPREQLMTEATLVEFFRTGALGALRLHLSREEVRETLGPPDEESVVRYSDGKAKIWKYGDIEVYFSEEGIVWMLHADAFHGRAPRGSPAHPIDPGVIQHGAEQTLVERALSESGVHFEQVDYPALRGYASVIRTESGAELWFKEQKAEAGFAGLYSFSLKAED